MRCIVAVAVAIAALSSFAFQPIPKASARALGVTRGKSFSKGLVFINGKYLPPPYVVERWGTGIRINSTPVTGQVLDWNEFLKTQPGLKIVKSEPEATEPAPEAEVAEKTNEVQKIETATADVKSLDDIFGDESDASEAKAETPPPAPKETVRKSEPPPKPKATVSYELEGEFVKNDAAKVLLRRVNQARTEIDRILRTGGFICFGDRYPRVTGDNRTLKGLLAKLPELQQKATDEESFVSSAYAANIVYLNEILLKELYKNRIDYLQLKRLRTKLNDSLEALLSGD